MYARERGWMSQLGLGTSDAHIRASDADRERMEKVLERNAGEGRLTMEELADRLARARSAVTIGDLRALAVDLPAEEALVQPPRARSRWGWVAPVVALFVALNVLRAMSFWMFGWGPWWYPHRHFTPFFPGPIFLLLILWIVLGRRRRRWNPQPR